jgi:hypothetical protein
MRTIDGLRAMALVACLALAACEQGAVPVPAQPAPPPAELQVGDIHVLASTVDTTALPERVTTSYGIPRGEHTWMLLVAVRRGSGAGETSVPAQVRASARSLNGNRIDIPMRALKTSNDYLDNVGTFSISPPDTLRFKVEVTPQGAPASTLEFTREVAR